ncbi:hypothetical protein FOYG_15172 [Fusarium oxysporum NRRL 32931]|uniref:Carrier domain-containing protein n=1 Tax=Fusarium oxysporum NRRL 32931 TaxID=660029 RepID=W9HS97_FUSOX|nr:hypothetical protein FOYG_15172 [Fusarium oxysporum NRRL 32931]
MSDKVNSKLLQELFASIPLSDVFRGNEAAHDGLNKDRELTANEEAVADAICQTLAIDHSVIYPQTNIFEIGIDSLKGLVARSINSNSGFCVNHIVLKMNPSADPMRLQNAWQDTIKETEKFVPLQSGIVQVVLKPNYSGGWIEGQYNDLEVAMAHFQSRQKVIGLDISNNMISIPPLRIEHVVTTVSRQPLELFISIHHGLYDGVSLNMLLQDFAARYLPDMAPPKRGSPEAFIKHIYSQNIEKSESYWRQTLAGCRPTTFKKPVSDPTRHVHSTMLWPSLPELESCAACLKSTLPSLTQAVFALTLTDAVSASDVTYSVVLSGRMLPVAGANSVLLPCIATIPARLNMENLSSVEDVVKHVHKGDSEALDYQHTSLRHIQRWIKAEGPIFDCLFSFTKSAPGQSHWLWEEMESSMPSEYPLALEVEADEKNKRVLLTCGFTSYFGQTDDAQDIMEKLNLIISALVLNPSISLNSLNLSWSSATAITETKKDWEGRPWSNLEVEICDLVMRFSGLEGIGALAHSVFEKTEAEVPSLPRPKYDDEILLDEFTCQVERLSSDDTVESAFKCSPLQTAMITQIIESKGIVYFHPHIVRLTESTVVDRLKEVYRLMAMAKDILRTSFHPVPELEMDYYWVGAIHSDCPPSWQERSVPPGTNIAQAVMQLVRLDTQSAFSTPPIQPLVASEDEESLLVIIMHHAIYDGASLPFIFNDLASAYQGISLPMRPPFATAVRSLSQDQTEACQFWTSTFEGYEAKPLPSSSHQQLCSEMFYSEAKVELDMTEIFERCKEMEVTVQSVTILAYAKVLATLTEKRDVAFGQVLAGRSSLGLEAEYVVGPLFNTVAKRVTPVPKFINNRNKKNVRALQDDLMDSKIWMPYVTDDYIPRSEYKMNTEVEQTDKEVTVRASSQGEFMAKRVLDRTLKDFSQAFCDIIQHPLRCVTIFPDELQSLPLSFGSTSDSAISVISTPGPSHEPVIRDILSKVSKVSIEAIQPDTSIFSIGLDSLSAIRVASMCRAAGFKAGVSDILQGNILRGICLRIHDMSQENTSKQLLIKDYSSFKKDVIVQLGMKQNAIEKIFPCLSGQMYHLASWLQTGRTHFEPAWPFSCSERISLETMKDAWFLLRDNNPNFRTCFYAISPSEVVQIVLSECGRNDGTFQVITSMESLENLAIAQAQEAVLKPSSLKTPPVRLLLLKGADRHGIHVLINHAIYDAWTMPLFINEFTSHYRRVKPTSRPDFASFIEFTLQSLEDPDEATCWRSAISQSR